MCSPRPSSNVSLVGGWYWVSERGPGSQGWVIGAAEVRLGGVERIQEVRWWWGCNVMDWVGVGLALGQERMEDGYGQESSSRRRYLLKSR